MPAKPVASRPSASTSSNALAHAGKAPIRVGFGGPIADSTPWSRRVRLRQNVTSPLIVGSGTTNVDARDFSLRGRELMFANKRDRETFEQSTVCFRRAIELDPNAAPAWTLE